MQTFNRKAFVKAAEGYLLKRLETWLEGIRGTALEPLVLKMARGVWILPNEHFEAILVSNIFPDVDLKTVTDAVEAGRTPENEAKRYIAKLVDRSLKDIADELAKMEDAGSPALPEPLKNEPSNNPPPLPVGEPPLSGEVRGYVAEVKHSPVIKHTITFDGTYSLYTFDKSLAETAKAAKQQKIHLLAFWTVGEFGCRLETLKPIDAPKLVEEIIP